MRNTFSSAEWCLVAFSAIAMCYVPPAAAETLIVVAGPATGPYAERTRAIEQGARRAAESLNASAGSDFVIETIDDGCDDAKAAGVARALVARRAALVLGHPCANAAIAAAEIYGKSETVFIASATRHPRLTDKRAGPAIYRLSGRDEQQGYAAARFMAETLKGAAIAIVHDRTLYAKSIAGQALEVLKAAKVETISATIVGGDKEYDRLVAKIKSASTVFYAGFPLEAGFILKALRRAGSKAEFLVSDTVATDEFTRSFEDAAGEVTALLPQVEDARAAEAAVEIFASAAERASKVWPPMPAGEAISQGWHQTVLGGIHFNEAGNANVPDYVPSKWNGAHWAPVVNPPSATPR